MNIKFISMAYKLAQYKRVVLYGVGNMAKKIYKGLFECNIKIDYCVVTKKQKSFFMNSIPMFEINECVSELEDNIRCK